jgi:sortase A
MPALVDIRDDVGGDVNAPRTALEGERALAGGALAPDTATTLPTMMLIAGTFVLLGMYLIIPRRRRRLRAWRTRRVESGHGVWRLRSVHRRRVGTAFAAGGGLLLVLGSREYAEGAQAQRRARAEWLSEVENGDRATGSPMADASVTPTLRMSQIDSAARVMPTSEFRRTASAVPLPELATSGREIRRGTAVARLTIDAIDLDEIVLEGVGPVELNGGPGHFPGSVLPGGAGNSILSAHRDRHFRRVGELGVGAKIRTETREGTVDWVVTERRIVSKDTPSLFEESDATLTLTTCWPLRYFGPAPDRLLIIAKRAT